MLRLEDGRFRNLHPHPSHGWTDLLRWQFGLGPRERPMVDGTILPAYRPEWVPVDIERISRPPRHSIQVTWIGHSTFLIQVAGLNFLTDPVFGRTCSPFPTWRLRRRAPLPIAFERLPSIHAVLLSHNHYDHLESRTVRRLGHQPVWLVPLGNAAWFAQRRHENVLEIDWWQEAELGPVSITAVPAQHWSGRTPLDQNLTLWCGYVLRTPAGSIYFAGDSGYAPFFVDIGHRLGPMRLSLLPIGSYQPRWFMAPMHLNPEEAVRVHLDVRSELSIGMHWGTFRLSDEPMAEPPIALRHQLARRHESAAAFRTLQIGETLVI